MNFLRKRPWLWIVFAFLLLFVGWGALLKIARENQPATVELQTREP